MTFRFQTFSIPLGEFSVALDLDGAVAATAFGSESALRSRTAECNVIRDTRPDAFLAVRAQVRAYFAGELREFSLPIAPRGTPFQQKVWAALQCIPVGETRSYGELAGKIDRPGAARAVGRANATNPICLFIPCHRVIGADGSLTGFAFGEDIKRRLLDHEHALARR